MFTTPCVSNVTCRMSHVTGHMSQVTFPKTNPQKMVKFSGASRWKICYQQGLPRLLFGQRVGTSQWKLCYQRGLPRLVCIYKCYIKYIAFKYSIYQYCKVVYSVQDFTVCLQTEARLASIHSSRRQSAYRLCHTRRLSALQCSVALYTYCTQLSEYLRWVHSNSPSAPVKTQSAQGWCGVRNYHQLQSF